MNSVRKVWAVRPWTRHSLVLLVAGFVYVAIGIAYTQDVLSAERQRGVVVALNLMSLELWGAVFILCGLCAILSARWPVSQARWGYTILTGLSAAWASGYVLGIVFGLTAKSNFTSAVIWSLCAFLWWAISGLLNPITVFGVPGGRRKNDPPLEPKEATDDT